MSTRKPQWWLMKSEPDVYGIDHLKAEQTTLWDGIRNYPVSYTHLRAHET